MHSAALVFMWQPIPKKRGGNLPLVAKISLEAFKQFKIFFLIFIIFIVFKKKYK